MRKKAALTSLYLCLLFLLVYGSSNVLAAARSGNRSLYFHWERSIPFVGLMVIPYLSIDLLFVAAPFFCRDERQMRTLAQRLTAAILIAGAFFFLFPLRFAFGRPPVAGWLGTLFEAFRMLDQPYNLFPSLHVADCFILGSVYRSRLRGLPRLLIDAWFLLIIISTLLTYQHHFIDVLGGAILGFLCLYLFQEEPLALPVIPNPRIGCYYLAGALILCCLIYPLRPWGLLLLSPAFSLALAATAYFGLGPGIYRKRAGHIPILTGFFLWPLLLAQRISLAWYSRRSNPYDPLTDRIWIGRRLSQREARHAIEQGVGAVLDLCCELPEPPAFRSIPYLQLPILDLTAPTPQQLDQAIAFISQFSQDRIVYIHCKAGYSRTAAIAAACLLSFGQASNLDDALSQLRQSRPHIVIRPEIPRALHHLSSLTAPHTPLLAVD